MGILSELEPKSVFTFFEEICAIPHGSGNTDQLSEYLVNFAKKNDIFYQRDTAGNVILKREATPGYEQQPPLILQGHMDMVAVKKPESTKDLQKEGIVPVVIGDKVMGEDTSLGGDDGIALAYGLALLSEENLRHPRLEVIFTVEEEVGMDGARAIDLSHLVGRRLINLDSEEEGIFQTGCAGGARADACVPVSYQFRSGVLYWIKVGGLAGGHSGMEIHKGKANANILLGRLLHQLPRELNACLVGCGGGVADNAIPREAWAKVLVNGHQKILDTYLQKVQEDWRKEWGSTDPDLYISLKVGSHTEVDPYCEEKKGVLGILQCADEKETRRLSAYLCALPNGVQAMSKHIPGMVETSLNLGVISMDESGLHARFSVRSSVNSAKQTLLMTVESVTALAGGSVQVSGDYPAWSYREHSPLREKMAAIYREMYQAEPLLQTVHAGLECGIFCGKLEGLDCVSIGPNMGNVHTTEEYLEISSVKRVWEYLIRLLAEKE